MRSEAATRTVALQRVREQWIPEKTELFRHLRPPQADTWLAVPASSHDEAAAWSLEGLDDDGRARPADGTHPRLAVEAADERRSAALAAAPSGLLGEHRA